MRRVRSHILIIGLTAVAVACSDAGRDAAQHPAAVGDAARSGEDITITGCLTAAPDRGAFVVTALPTPLASSTLRATQGEVPTYAYELAGAQAQGDLNALVGKEVAVRGTLADRDDSTSVEQDDKVELPERRVGDDKVTPAIETTQEVDVTVRRLQVASVSATGGMCPSGQ